jgi:hypothetical protein
MKRVQHLTIMVIVGISLLGCASVEPSPTVSTGGCRYFAKTGHYVCDRFLDFYQARGGLSVFGYPTTEAFVDPTHDGLRVQYFQRARMEEHPYNEPPHDVQLGLLVDELGLSHPPTPPEELPAPDDPSQHYFPETQHVVSHDFLDFFRANGGLDMFGYPRSDMVYEDGLVVQYFQRARMEWHRDNAPGQQIVLSKVGEWYLDRFSIPGRHELPLPPPRGESPTSAPGRPLYQVHLALVATSAGPSRPPPAVTTPRDKVTGLDVSASVRYPITGRTGTQTTYVYVNDQDGRPVAGAEANLVVHYQPELTCAARPTDASGFTRCSFEIPSPPVGERVLIDVTVAYQDLTATTQTFFMPWW